MSDWLIIKNVVSLVAAPQGGTLHLFSEKSNRIWVEKPWENRHTLSQLREFEFRRVIFHSRTRNISAISHAEDEDAAREILTEKSYSRESSQERFIVKLLPHFSRFHFLWVRKAISLFTVSAKQKDEKRKIHEWIKKSLKSRRRSFSLACDFLWSHRRCSLYMCMCSSRLTRKKKEWKNFKKKKKIIQICGEENSFSIQLNVKSQSGLVWVAIAVKEIV